jgi:hypothetical protein
LISRAIAASHSAYRVLLALGFPAFPWQTCHTRAGISLKEFITPLRSFLDCRLIVSPPLILLACHPFVKADIFPLIAARISSTDNITMGSNVLNIFARLGDERSAFGHNQTQRNPPYEVLDAARLSFTTAKPHFHIFHCDAWPAAASSIL